MRRSNKKLIKRKYTKDGLCICGKKYKKWINYWGVEIKGKIKIVEERVGYPINSCHCGCGKKWNEHSPKENNHKNFKNKCVSFTIGKYGEVIKCKNRLLPINHKDKLSEYEMRGNYCIQCSTRISENAPIFYKKNKEMIKALIK